MASTPEGKARSRMNALKHGLRATDELFIKTLKPNDRNIFREISDSLHEDYNPQTTHEKLLVDRIAIQHFRSYRLYQIEERTTGNQSSDIDISKSIIPHLDRFSRYDYRIQKDIRILHNRLFSLYIRRSDFTLNLFPAKE